METSSISTDKLKALDNLKLLIDKEVGKGSLFFGDDTPLIDIPVWPVSSPMLTHVLGRGLPKGRIMEIYGPEMSGKTTVATILAGDVQKQGGVVGFIDSENAYDKGYAKKLGLDTSVRSFIFSQPDSGEHALQIAESMVNSGAVDLIIVDSVAALTPQAEIDGNFGDSHMGLQARLMSQAMRKLTYACNLHAATIIFINQIRMKIGVMFGNPETTTGGKALPFYASIRLEVRKVENITEGPSQDPVAVGQKVRIKAVKNKTATPFRKVEADLYFGKGFDVFKEYVDFGVTYGYVEKSGSWYSYGSEKAGQGKDNAANFFKDNPVYFQELKEKVDSKLIVTNIDDDAIGEKKIEDAPKKRGRKSLENSQEGVNDFQDSKIE